MNERLKTHSKTQKKSADLVSNKLRIGVFQRYQMKCKSVSKKSPRYKYRRSHELRQPLDDAGAWQMYSHYYEELASDRQQGFEMLFNEVYAQVYDRVLREKQREPEA
ncbi:hypothetical protein D7X44_RS18620 [Escherichia coli]|nr:hypothetical protein [Escherichia coli]